MVVVAAGNMLFSLRVDISYVTGPPLGYFGLLPWGVAVLMLAVRPVDILLIRVASASVAICLVAAGVICAIFSAQAGAGAAATIAAYAQRGIKGRQIPGLQVAVVMGICSLCATLAAVAVVGHGGRACRSVHPRQRLLRTWLMFRLVCLGVGLVNLISLVANVSSNPFYNRSLIGPTISAIANCFIVSILFSRSGRGNFTYGLARLVQTATTELKAAMLAGSLSIGDPLSAVLAAEEHFRAQPALTLASAHFEAATSNSTLFALSAKAHLGTVHAFISHSHHDQAAKMKTKLVHEWAAEQETPSDQVLIWLDKTCIAPPAAGDQIVSIGLLPAFVAGCQQLLILLGRSYTSRLWCLFELFSFVQVGGKGDSITILSLAGVGDVATMFHSINVAKAQCHEPSDRNQILAVIETSFGSLRPFNQSVRRLYASITTVDPPEGQPDGQTSKQALPLADPHRIRVTVTSSSSTSTVSSGE